MSDVIFIAATIVFFAICVLYIHWCDKIIGPDDYRSTSNNVDETVAVVDTDTGRGGHDVIANASDNWVGLVLAVLGVIYLICVLVFPERF